MNIDDYLTHVDYKEDLPHLTMDHLDVNMRLYQSSEGYRKLIQGMCDYIREICLTTMDGYKKPHGMSAANVGLGLNIIGVTRNRNRYNEYCQIMINPKLVGADGQEVEALSNCGSIRLPEPIKVNRFPFIQVSYFDESGVKQIETFSRSSGAFTIQHEIEHNLGILITDK